MRTRTTSESALYDWNLNGPVPTSAVLPKSLPALRTASGEIGARYGTETESRNGAYGVLNRTRPVASSTTSVPSYGPRSEMPVCDFVAGSTMRSNVNFTACALNGVPSWNFTSLRSLNVYVFASGEICHDSARPASNFPAVLCHTSGSNT